MAYKIIGGFNALLGLMQAIIIAIMFFFVMPKLAYLYSQSSMDLSPYQQRAYLFGGSILLMGITNLFLGLKLFSKTKEKYYKASVISLVVTILLLGLFLSITMTSIITPIYLLTTNY